jgi:hypothetical protein
MTDNKKITEQHGCIVCGKTYNTLVIYAPDGRFIDATVTSPGGKRVADPDRPIVACTTHATAEIEEALASRYPGKQQDEDEDN